MKKTLIIGTLFSVLCLSNAFALDKPQAAKEDQRVLYTDFRADEVYPVTAASGIITTIVFSPSEQVQSYGSGFSTAWEFLSRGNYFFLKPKATDGRTNLVVVTNRRSYLFDIRLGSRAKATYRLTFRYPLDEIEAAKKEAEKKQVKSLLSDSALHSEEKDPENKKTNCQYTMNFGSAAASKTIAPIKAFDDNRFTYLKFKEQTDFPAAYRVQDGEETLLNSHVEDGWLVLHGVYEEVRLRAGKAVVGIYNENYQGGGASDKRAVSVKGLYRQIKHKE